MRLLLVFILDIAILVVHLHVLFPISIIHKTSLFIKPGATGQRNAAYGLGSGPILLDQVQCIGNESNIFDCPRNQIGVHDCSHSEDAGVTCSAGEENPLLHQYASHVRKYMYVPRVYRYTVTVYHTVTSTDHYSIWGMDKIARHATSTFASITSGSVSIF